MAGIITVLALTVWGFNSVLGISIQTTGRWINLEGWNIPDVQKMKIFSSEIKTFPEIKEEIILDEYRLKDSEKSLTIFNKRVYADCTVDSHIEVPWRVDGVDIYKKKNSCEVIFYKLYVLGEMIRSVKEKKSNQTSKEKSMVGGFAGAGYDVFIVDFDNDGIFESLIFETLPSSLLYLLELKLKKN